MVEAKTKKRKEVQAARMRTKPEPYDPGKCPVVKVVIESSYKQPC